MRAGLSQSHAVYDAVYSRKDYAGETRRLLRLLRGRRRPPGRRLLEVACGTGLYLEHLRRNFDVEGLDLSAGMLRVARRRLPHVRLHRDDMRTFDLGKRFDVVVRLFTTRSIARRSCPPGSRWSTTARD